MKMRDIISVSMMRDKGSKMQYTATQSGWIAHNDEKTKERLLKMGYTNFVQFSRGLMITISKG